MAAKNGDRQRTQQLPQCGAEFVSTEKRKVALNIAEAFSLLSDAPSAFTGCKNCGAAYYQHGPKPLVTRLHPCDHFADRDEEHAKAIREFDEWVLNKIVSLL